VTLYNGAVANGTGTVELLLPDGSKQSNAAAPSWTFNHLTQAGAYGVRLQGQSSAAPAGLQVQLSAASPTVAVRLQRGGASLALAPVAAQPLGYAFDPTTFYYSVQFTPAADLAADVQLDLDPGLLPPGWTYGFNPPVLRGAGTGTLAVTSALGCSATSVALQARAMVGGAPQAGAAFSVAKGWSLALSMVWVQTVCPSGGCQQQYMAQALGTGVPSGAVVQLQVQSCPTWFGLELGVPPATSTPDYSAFCGPVELKVNAAPTSLMVHTKYLGPAQIPLALTYCNFTVPYSITGHP